MDTQGTLQVVIPTYQRSFALIKRALESALAQTYKNIVVMVVDDNRGDKGEAYTQSLLEGLRSYPQVAYQKTQDGHGAQAARNTGLKLSNSEFIAFLDDDDEWMPELAEKEIALLRAHPDAGMAFCMGYKVYEDETPVRREYYCKPENFVAEPTFADMLVQDRVGTTTQAVMRRSALVRVGKFDVEQVARQDYEMWLRISREMPIVGVPEPLFNYNMHCADQISRSSERAIAGYRRVYEKYAADFAKHLGARESAELTLAGLYEQAGQRDLARQFRLRAKRTKLQGALKMLMHPHRIYRVLKERAGYKK